MIEGRIGFGSRLIAGLIDGFLSTVGGLMIGFIAGGALGGALGSLFGIASGEPEGVLVGGGVGALAGALFGALIGIGLFSLFYGLIEALTGASPAKRMLSLKIRNADGSEAPIGRLVLRYALKNCAFFISLAGGILGVDAFSWLSGLAGLAIFIGCFFVLGYERQALHDMIAETAVYPATYSATLPTQMAQ